MTYAPAVITARITSRSRLATAALVVAGVTVTALAAQLRIPLWPVPITGSTFAVLLTGAALGWRAGAATQLLYLVVGAAGVPVFAEASAGLDVLVGPTAGYLFAYPVAAAIVGRMAERRRDRRFWTMVGAFVVGSAVLYAFGVVGLMASLGLTFQEALEAGVYPFLIGDAIKAAAAGLLLPGAWRILGE